jgi:hypothetical protein
MNKRRCLVHVFGAHNMLPLVAAVRWYGIQRGNGEEAEEVTTVVHMPGWNRVQFKTTVQAPGC